MRRRYSVRPGRVPSGLGFVVGIVFTIIGIFGVIPMTLKVSHGFGGFGIFPMLFGFAWTGIAIFITIFHGYNAFSQKGSSVMNVSVTEDSDGYSQPDSAAARLQQLEQLKNSGLITQSEYMKKREEILQQL